MICRQRLHENQLPLNNILPTNKIEGEVSLRKLRPPYFYNFNRALELSQRIFTLVPVIASRRIGVIPSTIATSIRIVRIGNHHLGDAHIAQHLTKSFPRKNRIRLRTMLLAETPASVSALFPTKEGRNNPKSPKRTVFPSSISSDMMSTSPAATKSTVFL